MSHAPSPAAPARTEGGPGLAIAMAAAAFALLSVADVLAKSLTGGHTVFQIMFLNASFALIPIGIACVMRGGLRQLVSGGIKVPLLRSLCSFTSGTFGIYALSQMPLADAYALAFTAPLFITALSGPILGEPVGWRRWSAVMVGFLGVLVMLRPGHGSMGLGAVSALGGALFYSIGMLLVRSHRARVSSIAFAFYSVAFGTLANGLLMPFLWQPVSPAEFVRGAGAGLAGGTALLMLLTAFGKAPAAIISPFQYTQMVWAVLWGYLVFRDLPDGILLVGAGIVIASGLFILHRETRLNRPPAPQPATTPSGPVTG